MKNIIKKTSILLGIISLLALNACKDDISPLYDQLDYDRVFSPLGLEAKIENQTIVSLSWDLKEGISTYNVEISFDSLQFSKVIHTATVKADELPYKFDCPAGDELFSVRVAAVSGDASASDSKWSAVTFETDPENLFIGYDLTMDALNTITLSWVPGKQVSHIALLSNGTVANTFDVSAAEMTAGKKTISGVNNGLYEVQLVNDESVRGFMNYTMEGNNLLADGGDLAAAITAASPGDVIVLEEGGHYGFLGDMTLEKSIKIKGLDGKQSPVVYVTDGDRMFYMGTGLTLADSIVFENLYMSGATNLVSGKSDMIRGVFDQETGWPCNIKLIKFQSCQLNGFGRNILRLRGNDVGQNVGTFVVDDCIIRNLGLSSRSYGIISSEASTAIIDYVQISNSTVDSVRSNVIRYEKSTCQKFVFENNTVNRAPYSDGRYLMRVGGTSFAEGLEIKNCIFGETSVDDAGVADAKGINIDDASQLIITDSYATSDYVEIGNAIADLLIPLGVESSALWTDPENGDLSFRGQAPVEAGDPRWQ